MKVNSHDKDKKVIKRIIMFAVCAVLVVFTAFVISRGLFATSSINEISAQTFVNLQETNMPAPGFRRAHAKGVCLSGEFRSSGALSQYSDAKVFSEGDYPFMGRFSIAGNNPTAPDLKAPVRSLAFAIDLGPSHQWRVAMNTPPVMAVGTPDAFYKQLSALAPDPLTGKRDPSKIKAFFKNHPESAAFNKWKESYRPTKSFAAEQYHSINAFFLHDGQGNSQAVRFMAVPQFSDDSITIDTSNDDALQSQLFGMLENGEVIFNLEFVLANARDDETNPTVLWPKQRQRVMAGQLVITSASAQTDSRCGATNFDPLILPEGISATADPILRARSAAYAESYRRRAKERLLNDNDDIQAQLRSQ
ncbi:catalase family peroxidase [Aliiglaciecola lipolytica]|uniref:Catalase-related peroxidase n=1 Tax=Aliiglaciecola lipolytica E3 TaxID=1127673 RepID=K6YRS7_9ALTE|nr:catalase family peroxidase [Aliiglaciecola lipolytica]GAC14020.1 protein srpA [Aliiglaciecola lipolytica E3]